MMRETVPQRSVQPLLTPEDVARILGISRLQVIRASQTGRIPALKIGKCYRYRETTIVAWLQSQERTA